MEKAKSTEVDAYVFIKSELKTLGWDTRNPAVYPEGQVYTQNQCLSNPEIKKWLDKKRPEAIVKVNETTLWVIEAKSERSKIGEALDEAENYYAKRLNQSASFKTLFISGVAGNDSDYYIVANKSLEHGIFKPITLNDKEMTGLLSPEIAKRVMETESSDLKDVPIDQAFFMQKADHINEILHIGAVNINDRARVMAALLLSTLQGDLKDLNATPSVLISDINTRAENALASQGKKEFYEYVRLSLPTSMDNHQKYKLALVKTLKELYGLNIRSAMNSGSDVLGQFYEVFLKYGNWAQKMGIVLTPRHITRFAAEALDVSIQDIILDPCCGTGGFLVAAFDYVKASTTHAQIEHFKKNNVFGIDQQPQLACLAIVNMIFRGDGKNNIIEGDCFAKWIVGTKKDKDSMPSFPVHYVSKKPETSDLSMVTKVLMNPSFAIEASDVKEYRFVQHALDQMVDGGLLFSVLPMGALYEQGEERTWREQRLIKENTLLSVVTFPH
jgi:type I restriction enzyme M protein